MRTIFERGAVVLSIDTEQIWGYRDLVTEAQFQDRFPDALGAHEKLLVCLRAANVRATWFVVGAMALRESAGAQDPRMAGLPIDWIAGIRGGGETTAPLWYRASFVERLRDARPVQEIGLHGGLTHLIWTDAPATRDVVRCELVEGVHGLEQVLVRPRSFSFPRNQEAYRDLLPAHGIRCYRGRSPALAWQFGQTLSGALLRSLDELRRTTPPPVWPRETLPGLWSIPASTFLYPIGPARARVIGLQSRVERFSRGLEAAARFRGIFHFCLHPENLAESPHGFSIFEDMMQRLVRARDEKGIEVLTMSDVVDRIERKQTYASQKQQSSHLDIFEAHRRS
jgi:hypothetical protein